MLFRFETLSMRLQSLETIWNWLVASAEQSDYIIFKIFQALKLKLHFSFKKWNFKFEKLTFALNGIQSSSPRPPVFATVLTTKPQGLRDSERITPSINVLFWLLEFQSQSFNSISLIVLQTWICTDKK